MKIKEAKKRGRPVKKEESKDKLKLATEKSHSSRTITKIVTTPVDDQTSINHTKNKLKQFSLSGLTEYFKKKFDLTIMNEETFAFAQQKFWNQHLIPIAKQSDQILKPNEIILNQNEALDFLQTLSRTLDKSHDFCIEEIPHANMEEKNSHSNSLQNDKIMIKKNSNLSTTSDTGSRNEEHKTHHETEEQYIDRYESEYVNEFKKDSKSDIKKTNVKWLGKAHDSYRLVENHKKSGIFYEPFIPSDIDSQIIETNPVYNSEIQYPITLKTIGIQLSLGLYRTYEDFKYDMKWMFNNSKIYQKSDPKLLKDIEMIEKKIL